MYSFVVCVRWNVLHGPKLFSVKQFRVPVGSRLHKVTDTPSEHTQKKISVVWWKAWYRLVFRSI